MGGRIPSPSLPYLDTGGGVWVASGAGSAGRASMRRASPEPGTQAKSWATGNPRTQTIWEPDRTTGQRGRWSAGMCLSEKSALQLLFRTGVSGAEAVAGLPVADREVAGPRAVGAKQGSGGFEGGSLGGEQGRLGE